MNVKMTYNLRARKPPRRDALLAACHDALPREILEYILLGVCLLVVAMGEALRALVPPSESTQPTDATIRPHRRELACAVNFT